MHFDRGLDVVAQIANGRAFVGPLAIKIDFLIEKIHGEIRIRHSECRKERVAKY